MHREKGDVRVVRGGDVVVGERLGHVLVDPTMVQVEQVVLWTQ